MLPLASEDAHTWNNSFPFHCRSSFVAAECLTRHLSESAAVLEKKKQHYAGYLFWYVSNDGVVLPQQLQIDRDRDTFGVS